MYISPDSPKIPVLYVALSSVGEEWDWVRNPDVSASRSSVDFFLLGYLKSGFSFASEPEIILLGFCWAQNIITMLALWETQGSLDAHGWGSPGGHIPLIAYEQGGDGKALFWVLTSIL